MNDSEGSRVAEELERPPRYHHIGLIETVIRAGSNPVALFLLLQCYELGEPLVSLQSASTMTGQGICLEGGSQISSKERVLRGLISELRTGRMQRGRQLTC